MSNGGCVNVLECRINIMADAPQRQMEHQKCSEMHQVGQKLPQLLINSLCTLLLGKNIQKLIQTDLYASHSVINLKH